MAKRADPKTVGLFVLGAITLSVIAVAVFGSGNLFRQTHEFVCFFDGNVNGLRVGAAVKFKGVEIGQVSKIRLRLEQQVNRAERPVARRRAHPGSNRARRGKRSLSHGSIPRFERPAYDSQPDSRGSARSARVGQLCHRLAVRCPRHRAEHTLFRWWRHPGAPLQEIPAVPEHDSSRRRRWRFGFSSGSTRWSFNAVVTQMTGMLESVRQITNSPSLKEAINHSEETRQQLDHTLAGAQQTLGTVNGQVRPLSDWIQKTSSSADAAAKQATKTLGTVQTTIEPNSPINYQALQTLQERLRRRALRLRNSRTTCSATRARSSAAARLQPGLTDDLDQIFQNFPRRRHSGVDCRDVPTWRKRFSPRKKISRSSIC